MAIKRVFKNTMINSQYLFKNGKAAAFKDGRYETEQEDEIAQLDYEIANGTPHLYVDPEDYQVDTTLQDKINERIVQARIEATAEYNEEKRKESEEGKVFNLADPDAPKSGDLPPPVVSPVESKNLATLLGNKSQASATPGNVNSLDQL